MYQFIPLTHQLNGLSPRDSYLPIKRLLDITLSLAVMVILAPLMLILALLVRRDGGRVFFRQQRVGCDGAFFNFYKFRTMVEQAEIMKADLQSQNEMTTGINFKMRRDPRVTGVGRYLRKYSLDELPQLWNVLRGDMSLVGPRPALPEEVGKYSDYQRGRLAVRQGLTCLWQVGGRSDLDFDQQVELDLQYIRNLSLRTDLAVLIKTIPAVLSGKGAY